MQLGPIIGGSLARPAERFPHLFGDNEFLKRYPYFLPCAVPATFSALAWVVTFLYLEETVTSPVSVSRLLHLRKDKANLTLQNVVASQEPNAIAIPDTNIKHHQEQPDCEKPLPLRQLLTPRVVIAAANYASLSLVDIAFRAVLPLFFSTPIHLGGLGLPPSTIGNILSAFGVLNGVFQVFFFAKIHDRWGSKKVFIAGIASAIPVFASFPFMNCLARTEGLSTRVWAIVAFQTVISIMMSLSYGKQMLPACHSSCSPTSIPRCNLYLHLGSLTESSISRSYKWTEPGGCKPIC